MLKKTETYILVLYIKFFFPRKLIKFINFEFNQVCFRIKLNNIRPTGEIQLATIFLKITICTEVIYKIIVKIQCFLS